MVSYINTKYSFIEKLLFSYNLEIDDITNLSYCFNICKMMKANECQYVKYDIDNCFKYFNIYTSDFIFSTKEEDISNEMRFFNSYLALLGDCLKGKGFDKRLANFLKYYPKNSIRERVRIEMDLITKQKNFRSLVNSLNAKDIIELYGSSKEDKIFVDELFDLYGSLSIREALPSIVKCLISTKHKRIYLRNVESVVNLYNRTGKLCLDYKLEEIRNGGIL